MNDLSNLTAFEAQVDCLGILIVGLAETRDRAEGYGLFLDCLWPFATESLVICEAPNAVKKQ